MERAKLIPMRMYLALTTLRDREEGQAMVEYALILALVSVAAVGILSLLGKQMIGEGFDSEIEYHYDLDSQGHVLFEASKPGSFPRLKRNLQAKRNPFR